MKRAIHLIKLAILIIFKYNRLFVKKLRERCECIYSIFKITLLLRNKNNTGNCKQELSSYYPDKGKLGKITALEERTVDLSIILPVYNVSLFIDECLESILSQRIDYSYEIIIVDDGSTDDTYAHLKKYEDNPNIVVYRKNNEGQSVARNKGIESAKGRYLMFVDGDDVLLPGAVNSLMDCATFEDADIAEGEIVHFHKKITEEMIRESKKKRHLESNKKNPFFVLTSYGYSVAKVFRYELWDMLRFPEGYIFEDVITKFILRRKANKVVYIGETVYGYRYNNNSSSRGQNYLKKLDSIWVFPKVVELCEISQEPFDDVFYYLALNHLGLLNYVTVKNLENDIKRACFKEIKRQFIGIDKYKPEKIPFMFSLLRRSILKGNLETWELVAETIRKYNLLKKWREIN